MRVGIYLPNGLPQSFKVYTENVLNQFRPQDIETVAFSGASGVPAACDLLWDVRSGGGNPPPDFLLQPGLPPLVVTIHGFAPMSLPASEYYRSWRERVESIGYRRRQMLAWARVQSRITRVIAVSAFTRSEVVALTGIEAARIAVCLHGVESGRFVAASQPPAGRPYLLHVSNDEPRKNIARIVKAFGTLRRDIDVELVLKVPAASRERYLGIEGVRVIAEQLSTAELADLYAGAAGFVFPSLYEGFGLPILEAMSAGCPVLTSTVSACPEVAGDAAVLVDPRSVEALTAGLRSLVSSGAGRASRVAAGLRRAAMFSWQASADAHLQAFRVSCSSALVEG